MNQADSPFLSALIKPLPESKARAVSFLATASLAKQDVGLSSGDVEGPSAGLLITREKAHFAEWFNFLELSSALVREAAPHLISSVPAQSSL